MTTAIKIVPKMLAEHTLETAFTYIQSNFICLPIYITKLESSRKLLADSIKVVNNSKKVFKMANKIVSKEIYNQFEKVIEKYVGIKIS